MLIHSSSQLLTLQGGPQRGRVLGALGIIENGAVVVHDEKIIAVGKTDELKAGYPDEPTLDASGCVLMPGFVDPHTHLIWAGDRADEFEMKMSGKPYLEILAEGGGIISTVKKTRAANMETLIAQSRARLLRMFIAQPPLKPKLDTAYRLLPNCACLKPCWRLTMSRRLILSSPFSARMPLRRNIKTTRKVTQIWSAARCCPCLKNGGGRTRRDSRSRL